MEFTTAGDFEREPQLDLYRDLVRGLASISHRALFITRHDAFPEPAEALLERLGPWCTVSEERSEWPNTALKAPNTEIIHEFILSPDVVQALAESVSGLYGWGSSLPEDLAFLREDGSVVFYSTTHEEEAGLCLSGEEKTVLEIACPWICTYVTWRAPTLAERRLRQSGR